MRAPFLPATTCVRLAIRHTPNPITAPPSTMMPMMMATTIRMAFKAPPPAGAFAGAAAAGAGLAAAPTNPPPVTPCAPDADATGAPHLVQNFPVPSTTDPQDVQNAMIHLDQRFDRAPEYMVARFTPQKEALGLISIPGASAIPLAPPAFPRHPTKQMLIAWPIIFGALAALFGVLGFAGIVHGWTLLAEAIFTVFTMAFGMALALGQTAIKQIDEL